jgi:hypothetical protein
LLCLKIKLSIIILLSLNCLLENILITAFAFSWTLSKELRWKYFVFVSLKRKIFEFKRYIKCAILSILFLFFVCILQLRNPQLFFSKISLNSNRLNLEILYLLKVLLKLCFNFSFRGKLKLIDFRLACLYFLVFKIFWRFFNTVLVKWWA